jgi:hypothetical protein
MPADSKPTLDMFTKNIGFTPNMMATFAQSPIALNSWAALLGSLSKALDVKTRDSIGLSNDHPAGDDCPVASDRFSTVLALEVAISGRSAKDSTGDPAPDPGDQAG